jgi:nucleoside-diphosphate-sugar epimerase
MTMPEIMAVTGATGFLGRALIEHLRPAGPVRALVRRRDARVEAWERRGCEIVVGDLHDERALAQLTRGAAVVYHCAATMAKGDPNLSHRVNVVGTENIARAACAARVRRFVYVSSISVFAATRPRNRFVTEGVEPERVERLNSYGRTKYAGELAVRRLGREAGLPYTILRPTNIYGPGSGPWFHQFERLLRWLPVALGDLPIDVVYVDDVVEAMRLAAGSPAAADGTFHIGHEMVRLNQFILEVARVTGRRARPLPRVLDALLRRAIDRIYRGITRTHMSMSLVRPVLYPHTLASAAFGYSPRVLLRDGFARLGAWYRAGPAAVPDAAGPFSRTGERVVASR